MSLTHWSSLKSIYASPMGRAQTTATKTSIAPRAHSDAVTQHHVLSPSTSVFAPRAFTVYIELATSPIPRERCGLSETTPFSQFSLLPTFSPR
ncbi:hypothetical protein L208DRAFT_434188 [Tricholoma matsutake]|nr:hypothetical protein L208DRAFT_434188 [Tricholoma matsutake 945]